MTQMHFICLYQRHLVEEFIIEVTHKLYDVHTTVFLSRTYNKAYGVMENQGNLNNNDKVEENGKEK